MEKQVLFSNTPNLSYILKVETELYLRDSIITDKRDCHKTPEITTEVKWKQKNASSASAEKGSVVLVYEEKLFEKDAGNY